MFHEYTGFLVKSFRASVSLMIRVVMSLVDVREYPVSKAESLARGYLHFNVILEILFGNP